MRQSLELLRRSSPRWGIWGSCVGYLGWVTARGMTSATDINHAASTPLYDVAFLGALLGMAVSAASLSPAWSWGAGRRAAHVGLTVVVAVLAPLLLLAWFSDAAVEPAAWLLGAVQMAVLAVISTRLTPSPGRSVGFFVLLGFAIPALLPGSGPLLDASHHFEALTFPRSPAALAPILTLAVIALALPSRSTSAILRGAVE